MLKGGRGAAAGEERKERWRSRITEAGKRCHQLLHELRRGRTDTVCFVQQLRLPLPRTLTERRRDRGLECLVCSLKPRLSVSLLLSSSLTHSHTGRHATSAHDEGRREIKAARKRGRQDGDDDDGANDVDVVVDDEEGDGDGSQAQE